MAQAVTNLFQDVHSHEQLYGQTKLYQRHTILFISFIASLIPSPHFINPTTIICHIQYVYLAVHVLVWRKSKHPQAPIRAKNLNIPRQCFKQADLVLLHNVQILIIHGIEFVIPSLVLQRQQLIHHWSFAQVHHRLQVTEEVIIIRSHFCQQDETKCRQLLCLTTTT